MKKQIAHECSIKIKFLFQKFVNIFFTWLIGHIQNIEILL
jgi:hypothetical protein